MEHGVGSVGDNLSVLSRAELFVSLSRGRVRCLRASCVCQCGAAWLFAEIGITFRSIPLLVWRVCGGHAPQGGPSGFVSDFCNRFCVRELRFPWFRLMFVLEALALPLFNHSSGLR